MYGNATSKEVVAFLSYHRTLGIEEKVKSPHHNHKPPLESPTPMFFPWEEHCWGCISVYRASQSHLLVSLYFLKLKVILQVGHHAETNSGMAITEVVKCMVELAPAEDNEVEHTMLWQIMADIALSAGKIYNGCHGFAFPCSSRG